MDKSSQVIQPPFTYRTLDGRLIDYRTGKDYSTLASLLYSAFMKLMAKLT